MLYWSTTLHIVGRFTVYCLKRLEVNLSEETITADERKYQQRMANGYVLVLSAKADNSVTLIKP